MATQLDLDAEHYRKHSQLQFSRAHKLLCKHQFLGDEQVLDVGCGDGKITAEIATHLPRGKIIGSDRSSAMIQLAKKLFPHLQFEQQDATNLHFSQTFDLITSFSCLHWIKNERAVLKHMKSLLKPSGKVLILTYLKAPDFWIPIETVADRMKWSFYLSQNPRPHANQSESGYLAHFAETGFEIEHFENSAEKVTFVNRQALIDHIRGWLPYLIYLPKQLHESFLDEIATESLIHTPPGPDGSITFSYNALYIVLKHH